MSGSDSYDSDGEGRRRNIPKKKLKTINNELLIGLNRLRHDEVFCDIKLKVGDEEIWAHKNVLCACSPYFNAMFTGPYIEKTKDEIIIQDIDLDLLKILIDYIYTGKLNHNPQNVERVLLAATFLQIESATDVCSEYLSKSMNLRNCLKFVQFAGKNSLKKLCDKALLIVVQKFPKLFMEEDFLLIEFDEFQKIISNRNVRNYPEDIICTTILRWVNYAKEARSCYLPELLEKINPCLVSRSFLHSSKHPLDPIDVYQKWISNYELPNQDDMSTREIFLAKRINYGFDQRTYKIHSHTTKKMNHLPDAINEGSYVGLGYNIYHFGGWLTNRGVLKDAYCMDLMQNKWMPFVPLKFPRAYHRSCILNEDIYTIGGSDGYSSLDFVEALDLYTGLSSVVANLPKKKEAMGIALHRNAIYSIGGCDRGRDLGCVHRFDPRASLTWDSITTTPYQIGTTSCAVVDEDIYCLRSEDTLQRYDVRANKWTLIHTQYKRYPDEIFTVDNVMYGLFKDHFAEYIADKGKWKVEMQFKFHHNYLTVVPNLISVLPLEPDANNESHDEEEYPN